MVISVKPSMIRKYCHGLKAYSGIVTLIIASICVVTTKVLEATLASQPRVDIQPDAYERTSNVSGVNRLLHTQVRLTSLILRRCKLGRPVVLSFEKSVLQQTQSVLEMRYLQPSAP